MRGDDGRGGIEPEPPDRRLGLVVVALAVIGAVLIGYAALWRGQPHGAAGDAPLELQRLGGGTVRLADLRGQVVALDFWATWCGPCQKTMPAMRAAARRAGVVLLAVDTDDESPTRASTVRSFLEQHGLSDLTVILDDLRAEQHFEVDALPTLVVLDRQGKVAARHVGEAPEDELYQVIQGVR